MNPNVVVVSGENGSRVEVVAVKDVEAGDEVCISYIDETSTSRGETEEGWRNVIYLNVVAQNV